MIPKISVLGLYIIFLNVAITITRFEPNMQYSNEVLYQKLNAEQFFITQHGLDEKPQHGIYYDNWENGTYNCIVCDFNLFKSEHKVDAPNGLATFHTANTKHVIKTDKQMEIFSRQLNVEQTKTQTKCQNCGSHIGWVFEVDTRTETGLKYVANSASMIFVPSERPSFFAKFIDIT